MFERFSERARQVVVLAQDEARRLRHNYIGTEHLLLGLMREEQGLAARVLGSFGITVEAIRADVGRIVGHGDELSGGQIPFTPRAKKILDLSLKEALMLGHNYIGTEHLLLGLVRENEGVAARIMLDYGASAEAVRDALIGMLSGAKPSEDALRPRESIGSADDTAAELERVRRSTEDYFEREGATATYTDRRRLRRSAPALAAGAGIFAAGLLVGWLIWG